MRSGLRAIPFPTHYTNAGVKFGVILNESSSKHTLSRALTNDMGAVSNFGMRDSG